MLPIDPSIDFLEPNSLAQALEFLAHYGSNLRIIAGGTDVLPNLKNGLYDERFLMSLSRVPGLRGIAVDERYVRIGVLTSLKDLSESSKLAKLLPALTASANAVAGPQHRAMGTIGGNLCLDTRCVYINQSHFWREALGFCLKKDGAVCHVVQSGKRCVAAASNDTAVSLIALDAEVCIADRDQQRWVRLDAFYKSDGIWNKVLSRTEMLTEIRVPLSATKRAMSYQKLRRRGSIDFPLLCLALSYVPKDGRATDLKIVVSAIAAKPKLIRLPAANLELCDATIEDIADRVYAQVRPLTNIDGDLAWRRLMSRALTRAAFEEARSRHECI